MKRKNIKAGEYVVQHGGSDQYIGRIMKVTKTNQDHDGNFCADVVRGVLGRRSADNIWSRDCFRMPRISDLKEGDWFENPKLQGEKYFVQIIYPTGWVKAYMEGGSCYMELEPDTKIKIISLASEKVGNQDPMHTAAFVEMMRETPFSTEVKAASEQAASDKLHAEMDAIKAEIEEPELGINVSEMGVDAAQWAKAFQRAIVDKGVEIDEGLMIGWFANAIEYARDTGPREQPEPEREVLKRWVNVWPQEVTRTFHSKSAADENSRWWEDSSTNGMGRIACVEIEIPYYEGEGL